MLFVKYLSDVYAETKEHYMKQYGGDERRVERAMSRERFVMEDTATFGFLYKNRNDSEIFTREWFAWQNTLFGELILKLIDDGKLHILNNII